MRKKPPGWLKDAVFYLIFPPSFYDADGDGIGDLPGIIRKLDYVKSLGCNAVWINPCFVSPFRDAGYDIADFYRVAPRYGTNADMRRLFREAKKKGIRVCLDLVPGHTSIEHPWFKASCRRRRNKYSNWYVWTDSPWRRPLAQLEFIRGYAERSGYYAVNWYYCQPALNYGFARPDPREPWQLPVNHPDVKAVRAEIRKIIRFWLDMGADGFRVDMASSLVKEDPDWRETSEFWREVRTMLDRDYPEAALISEWSYPAAAISAGFHVDAFLPFRTPVHALLFSGEKKRSLYLEDRGRSFFDREGKGDIAAFLDIYLRHFRRVKNAGYVSIPPGTHDIPRISVGRSANELEIIFAFTLTMPGLPLIHYGDEIGMRYLRNLASKEGGYNRTGSRTPMQWTEGRNCGFSAAPEKLLYLPVDKGRRRPTVAKQEKKSTSLLNRVRRLIRLRRQTPALQADGDFIPLYARPGKYPFVYLRENGKERILIALNPARRPVNLKLLIPGLGSHGKPEAASGATVSGKKGRIHLTMKGISYLIQRLAP